MFEFWSKNKNLLAIIAGLLSGFIVVMIFETISHAAYPPPDKLDYKNQSQLLDYFSKLPIGAFVLVLSGYLVGVSVIGFVSSWIAENDKSYPFWVSFGIFTVLVAYNYYSLPHPMWMVVTTFLLILPFALLGRWIALKYKPGISSDEASIF